MILCQLAGAVGALTVPTAQSEWYRGLVKPGFMPPSWLFAPVWLILYTMMGLALFLVWQRASRRTHVRRALGAFGLQLLLNATWTPVFFGLQRPLLALVVLIMLWLAIAATIVAFWQVRRSAAILLVPYFMWVSFAGVLNGSIAALNP